MRKRESIGRVAVLSVLLASVTSSWHLVANDSQARLARASAANLTSDSTRGAARRPTPKATRAAQSKRQEASAVEKIKAASKAPTSEEVAFLRELTLQQKQIEMLRASIDELRQRLDRATLSAQVTSAPMTKLGEVASLGPVVPAAPVVTAPAVLGSPPVTQADMQQYTSEVEDLGKKLGGCG